MSTELNRNDLFNNIECVIKQILPDKNNQAFNYFRRVKMNLGTKALIELYRASNSKSSLGEAFYSLINNSSSFDLQEKKIFIYKNYGTQRPSTERSTTYLPPTKKRLNNSGSEKKRKEIKDGDETVDNGFKKKINNLTEPDSAYERLIAL